MRSGNWRNLMVVALLAFFALANLIFHREDRRAFDPGAGLDQWLGLGNSLRLITLIVRRIDPDHAFALAQHSRSDRRFASADGRIHRPDGNNRNDPRNPWPCGPVSDRQTRHAEDCLSYRRSVLLLYTVYGSLWGLSFGGIIVLCIPHCLKPRHSTA